MKSQKAIPALKACFSSTIPVLTGYVFLGITYGILMRTSGFPVWLPILTAFVVYTGSMEFLLVEILSSSFNPLSAMATAFMVGARHLFYGIAMLQKYRNTGWKKPYLIYSTSDETFAVNYAAEIPEGIDKSWYYFWVSLLDQMYWVAGTAIGSVCGGFITVSITGLDFVMTAMFIVILMSQWVKDGTRAETMIIDHIPELIGIGSAIVCLLIFGTENFIIPTMIMMLVILTIVRRPLEKHLKEKEAEND
jgi:4-azaleucine resistance transporter AzlC